jgi:hypothetical protein
VQVVTGIAMGLPFFAAISGLIGAITYYPVSELRWLLLARAWVACTLLPCR